MRLSDPQRALLAEIGDGSARYIRQWSKWWRTVEALDDRGLISIKWAGANQYECQLTNEGLAFLEGDTE